MFSLCSSSGKSTSPLRSFNMTIPEYLEMHVPAMTASSIGSDVISHGNDIVGNPRGRYSFSRASRRIMTLSRSIVGRSREPESSTMSLWPFSVSLALMRARSPTLDAFIVSGQSNSLASAE